MTLKPGDKVLCISMDKNYNNKLIVGDMYIVQKIPTNGWLKIIDNYYEDKYFKLVQEKEKHYKWNITFNKNFHNFTEIQTSHYISEDKIEDYCRIFLKLDDSVNFLFTKIKDDFVED